MKDISLSFASRIALRLLVIILFCYSLLLLSSHLFGKDLMFHTDIARDMLLIEDVVINRDLTLIGPKAGGISGMFFGPIWIYMNLPFYLLGGGDPIILSYFWFVLVIFSIWSVYYIGKQVFNSSVGIICSLLFAFASVLFVSGFTQSFGSVLLSPWLLYVMYLYLKNPKLRYSSVALLINGFIYQFQPAVGMITLPVTCIIILYTILSRKRYIQLWGFLTLFIPFNTLIIFEVRHDFLQTHAFLNHFIHTDPDVRNKMNFLEYIQNRIESNFSIIDLLKKGWLSKVIFLGIYGNVIFRMIRQGVKSTLIWYKIFFLYLTGFIIITLLYKGQIIDYYFWAFLPLSIISFGGLITVLYKPLIYTLFIFVLTTSIQNAANYRTWWTKGFSGKDASSWILNKDVAEYVFHNTSDDFGYYVYSPDELGYSIKYAMRYIQKSAQYQSDLCKKKKITYLLYDPTLSSSKTNPEYWKNIRVNIQTSPIEIKKMQDIVIEKYILSDNELQEKSDPNIVCNLHFR